MAKTKTLRNVKPEVLQDIRFRVTGAVFKKGMTQKEASRLFGCGYSTVKGWCKQYRKKGRKGLLLGKRGRPKGQKEMSKQQEQWICRRMTDKVPDQLKLPFTLWTREAVRDLIRKKFGISKSLPQIGRYLQEWGFTPQKPVYKAYEQKPEAVKQWLEKEYPKIRRHAKKENAEVYWEDETGMRSDHQAGTSYAPVGQTPVIRRTGKRFRLNMISAISNRGKKRFMIFKDSFNGGKFLYFLKQLVKGERRKIHLIVDGHPAHKTKMVKAWLEKRRRKIELSYLPGYSPELNPQEYMNQDVKSNAVGKHRTLNTDQLQRRVEVYVKTRSRQTVRNYFKHPNVLYAA